jgi:exonuclease VII small subunit
VDAAHAIRPRLGRVLVDAGLLSDEQLQAALAEQTSTGRRLGEIVVERGYMSGPALANALATQHGGVVRTEYGLATGLPAPSQPDPEPEPEPTSAEPQSLSLLNVLEDWSGMLEELRGKVARLESELETAKAELEVSKSSLEATAQTLDAATRDLEAAREEARIARDELAAAQERLAETAHEPPPAEPNPSLPVTREVQVHTRTEAANGEHPAPVSDNHLMSVPTPSGFVLLERPGPTPAVGTQVRFEEDPDTTFVVTKVNAASELNPRPCAFLERL